MQFKHRKFATILVGTVVCGMIVGGASAIGTMIRQGPEPDEFLLRWDSSKAVMCATSGALVGAAFGVIRAPVLVENRLGGDPHDGG